MIASLKSSLMTIQTCYQTFKLFVKSVFAVEPPPADNTPGTFLVSVIPVGAFVTILIFFVGRKLISRDRCSEVVSRDIGLFIEEQIKVYDLIRCHQGGKPCNSNKSLAVSREEISGYLKSLTNPRERISSQISDESANLWKFKHLEWKDAMQGDSGFITGKSAVCTLRLIQIEKIQGTYQHHLVALRQRVAMKALKIRRQALISDL